MEEDELMRLVDKVIEEHGPEAYELESLLSEFSLFTLGNWEHIQGIVDIDMAKEFTKELLSRYPLEDEAAGQDD